MALPQYTTPTYKLILPSTKKEFKYHPFLVREQKALLIAQESEDLGVMLDTIKDIISKYAVTKINVDDLAPFDIEYIFMQMRAVSIGELVELLLPCDVDHGKENDKALARVMFDVRKAEVVTYPNHTTTIPLFDDVVIKMKYPTMQDLKIIDATTTNTIDQTFVVIASCIESIYNSQEVFNIKDQTPAEIFEFLNNLTAEQFAKIQQFFDTIPSLQATIEYTCPVCQKSHKKYVEGLASFF